MKISKLSALKQFVRELQSQGFKEFDLSISLMNFDLYLFYESQNKVYVHSLWVDFKNKQYRCSKSLSPCWQLKH